MRKTLFVLAVICLQLTTLKAQSDFGLWYSLSAEKKLSKKWSMEAEGELRTRNNTQTLDRWSMGIAFDYKLKKSLKLSGGYALLGDNNHEKITFHTDGTLNGWRPSYWGLRHRFNLSLQGKMTRGRFDISLRERWQYTWRPETTTDRYDFDDQQWDHNRTVKEKGKNVLRSRLQVAYNIKKSKVDPYANVELWNAWSVEKVRYTVGIDWKLKKKLTLGVAYRYQHATVKDDDGDTNRHIVGLNINCKL